MNPFRSLAGVAAALVLLGVFDACYSGGEGTAPPPDQLYFPVGLAVSAGGNVLYAVNSDFDLQWNGGTLQSYDLFLLRHDADALINANLAGAPLSPCPSGKGVTASGDFCLPVLNGWTSATDCTVQSNNNQGVSGSRTILGEACAPAVNSMHYVRDNVIVGAFATELLVSPDGTRLFSPIRGNASMTWADVQADDPSTIPGPFQHAPPDGSPADLDQTLAAPGATPWNEMTCPDGEPTPSPSNPFGLPTNASVDPFDIACFPDSSGQCTTTTGNAVDAYDTRLATLPGEPFAMALTPDGTAVAMAHQTSTESSLLLSGCEPLTAGPSPCHPGGNVCAAPSAPAQAGLQPSMQFVLTGMPNGGDGMAAIPHDPSPNAPAPACEYTAGAAVTPGPGGPLVSSVLPPNTAPCVRPAFLETNHSTAEIDLLRYYSDDQSTVTRPYLVKEVAYSLSSNELGTDERGVVVDPTPRIACRQQAMQAKGVLTPADDAACGLVPSRVFIASRSPDSLIIGQLGGFPLNGGGSFDPDLLVITGNVPLPAGPSNVYVAPIVNEAGRYELRVFVVCFDANQIAVYDPNLQVVESVIDVGPGPFAMAFDPFEPPATSMATPDDLLVDVATNNVVPNDTRQVDGVAAPVGTTLAGPTLKRYRFAYVASFTQSFVQMIDLDNSLPGISPQTFEHVVYTLGQPTNPKGQ